MIANYTLISIPSLKPRSNVAPPPPPVRTMTLNNGRVVSMQTGKYTIAGGSIQNVDVPHRIKVNGQWVRINNVRSVTGSEWNDYFRARYGSRNAEWVQRPPIGPNTANHLINVDGFSSRMGIKGAHNMHVFEVEAASRGILITNRTPHPTIPGITQIEYRIPVFDMAGNPILGQFKSATRVKTVFDPNVISNNQMYNWGVEAMRNGTAQPDGTFLGSARGLNFMGYKDPITGEIRNFFPILD